MTLNLFPLTGMPMSPRMLSLMELTHLRGNPTTELEPIVRSSVQMYLHGLCALMTSFSTPAHQGPSQTSHTPRALVTNWFLYVLGSFPSELIFAEFLQAETLLSKGQTVNIY